MNYLTMTQEDRRIALRITAITIGIVTGIILGHNALCVLSGGNCGTSLAYLL